MIKEMLKNDELNKIFVTKFTNYIDLMYIAGCTADDISSKDKVVSTFSNMSTREKARILSDDISFLDFFTNGGIVKIEGDNMLYRGINREITHSVVCTMSSIDPIAVLTDDYQKEIEGEGFSLNGIRDMVSFDMSVLFPDIKRLFFLGDADKFDNRMKNVFDNSNDLITISNIIDMSVFHKDERGYPKYLEMMRKAILKTKRMDFDEIDKMLKRESKVL